MKITNILPDKYTKKGTWIKDGVLMCNKDCCGAPVSECSCDSSCKKCNCYNLKEDGVIVPGVNTTVDVKPGETERQAAKFFGHNKNLLKKRNAKDPIHTLYNMGLVNESADIVWEKVVKQSDPLIVLDKVATRKDNSAFPVRMYDGSTIGVTPNTAKRIIDVYDNLEDDKKKKVEWFLRTKNGFKELAQLVMGRSPAMTTSRALQDHVEKAYEATATVGRKVNTNTTSGPQGTTTNFSRTMQGTDHNTKKTNWYQDKSTSVEKGGKVNTTSSSSHADDTGQVTFLKTKNGKTVQDTSRYERPVAIAMKRQTQKALNADVDRLKQLAGVREQGSTQRLRAQPHMTGLENPYQKQNKKELKVFTPAYKKMYDKAKAAQANADRTGGPGASFDVPVSKPKFSPEVLPPRTTPKKPRT
jgi:hypothetical protein